MFLGYDVPKLSRYFDWISVMTYDFHGHWDKQTGHVAPMYYYPGDTYDYFNAVSKIRFQIINHKSKIHLSQLGSFSILPC